MDLIKDKNSKFIFAGIALGGLSTTESAVALLDRNMHIITLDKLFSIGDVKYFLNNLAGKKNAVILISIPENEVMLSCKWKYNSRTYDLVNFDKKMMNRDGWTDRFSTRGSEYFRKLKSLGADIFRFYTYDIKMFYYPDNAFKDRTPVDCKALQDTFRIKYNMRELPVNMLPVAQLEAVSGAMCIRDFILKNDDSGFKIISEYEGLPVIGS